MGINKKRFILFMASTLTVSIFTWRRGLLQISFPKNQKDKFSNECPKFPFTNDTSDFDLFSLESNHKNFEQPASGGRFEPSDCKSRQRVAIIVPYRNRKQHLEIFANWMHFFLQKQFISYKIYIVEQTDSQKFNRAKLLNIGYVEARKEFKHDCYIFHDVDLIPLNRQNLYTCGKNPKHLSSSVNTLGDNKLIHWGIFGGVSAMSEYHLKKINGYPNHYWGWGAEDDDVSKRLHMENLDISRYPKEITNYYMLRHGSNINGNIYHNILNLLGTRSTYKRSGINDLHYDFLGKDHEVLFTRIKVKT